MSLWRREELNFCFGDMGGERNVYFLTKGAEVSGEKNSGYASDSMSSNTGAIIYQYCDLGKISEKLHSIFLNCMMRVVSILQDCCEN